VCGTSGERFRHDGDRERGVDGLLRGIYIHRIKNGQVTLSNASTQSHLCRLRCPNASDASSPEVFQTLCPSYDRGLRERDTKAKYVKKESSGVSINAMDLGAGDIKAVDKKVSNARWFRKVSEVFAGRFLPVLERNNQAESLHTAKY